MRSATSSNACKPTPPVPEWEQIVNDDAADRGARDRRPADDRPGRRARWTRKPIPSWRSVAGCWIGCAPARESGHPGRTLKCSRCEGVPRVNRTSVAWLFLAPALLVLGVFFLLPVLVGLALSLTDYDLYALADLRNLRFVGLHNYWELLHRPLFWSALGHTLYFVIVGVPLSMLASLGAALLLNSPLSQAQRVLPHRAVRAGGHHRGRGRGDLALPVQSGIRHGEFRAGAPRHPSGRLAGRSALGDADDHPVRGVEELRLQHDHLAGRPAGDSAGSVRGRAHRRRFGVAAVPPHHAADASRRSC